MEEKLVIDRNLCGSDAALINLVGGGYHGLFDGAENIFREKLQVLLTPQIDCMICGRASLV